ncbi:MAG: hypothetical protein LQ337_002695 [Flavoplaca oasis]|nr:MAG: hypothetical protein LQ337_002695 [Flavoplaca oasis]
MITYASRHLYNEITGIYFGAPRDLTVCLGLSDYSLAKERHEGKYTNYHLNLNGVIRSRDLAYTNFAFFKSINLHLQLPINGPATRLDLFNTVKFFVAEFSETIQDWQSRRPWWSIARCPPIHVLVDIPRERDSLLSWEVTLEDVADLLKPLGDIDNCEVATIDLRCELRCGREWISEVLGQIIRNMSTEGKDFRWVGENTAEAILCSRDETWWVRERVEVLQRGQDRRRAALSEVAGDDEDEEKKEYREDEIHKMREEEEELAMLLLGALPCGPPESQPDCELRDLIDRERARRKLDRILVVVILLEILVLDGIWTSLWS